VYSAKLLDHFQNPRNAGGLADPDFSARLENPVCGDILELSARVEETKTEGKRFTEIRFRAKGCVPVMACASAITELVKGKTAAEAREVSREELQERIGGVPEASTHACQLAIDTLAALLQKLETGRA
jgi:nitrogen fixation protein NifU and related proteins